MPDAQPCRFERILNRRPKRPLSPQNSKKILNRTSEASILLKTNGSTLLRLQNEPIFERRKQRVKLKRTFQMAGKPASRRQRCRRVPDERPCRSKRTLNRLPKCPRPPKNPKKIPNRGNELKDLLKPKGLTSLSQQNELVFERQKQLLKLRSPFQTTGKPCSRRRDLSIAEAVTRLLG